jgi:dienelactone hydrolase
VIQRLRNRFGSGAPPAAPGPLVDRADESAQAAAKEDFSRLPFNEELPSTALKEALPRTASQDSAVVASFLRILGSTPHRNPLAVTNLATWDCGDYLQEFVAIQSSQGQSTPAYVLTPKGANKPRPALVAIHGHGGNFLWGKSKITASRRGNPTYGYGIRLVRQGYVVLAPDLPGFEDLSFSGTIRQGPWNSDVERLLFGNLLLNGATLLGWNLLELSLAVDYLETRDDVDKEKIGVIGHSMGGTLAPLLALFDGRVRAIAASCGVGTWKTLLSRHIIHNFSCYVPGLLQQVGDLDVLLAALAPCPFMIIAGEMDDNFPVDGVRQLGAALEAPYTALKASDALEVQIDDEGHHFHEGRQQVAVAFLERWLLNESSTTKVKT